MKKLELLNAVVAANKARGTEVKLTQKHVEAVIDAYTEVVEKTLKENPTDRIFLGKFGIFKARKVEEKHGVSNLGGYPSPWVKPEHYELYLDIPKDTKEF